MLFNRCVATLSERKTGHLQNGRKEGIEDSVGSLNGGGLSPGAVGFMLI